MKYKNGEEVQTDYIEIKGEVIYDGTRKVQQTGNTYTGSLPLMSEILKGVEKGVDKILRARMIVDRNGSRHWLFSELKIVIPEKEAK